VYAFNWTANKVEWFLDGQSILAMTTGIPQLSAKIMMNLWIFSGDHFGPSSMNQYPIKATYDYFRFYKLDSEAKYPCAAPPGCLDAADHTVSSQNHINETGL
jgi:beta-glucanase (GH16 family)